MTDNSTSTSELESGRKAGETLWRNWTSRPEVSTSRQPDFANGFLDALIELQHGSPGVDKEMRRHAETAAASLTGPFHGVLEIAQNADLCRARHKSAYAEYRIMPTGRRGAWSGRGVR